MKESYVLEITSKKAELSGESNQEIRESLDALLKDLDVNEDSAHQIIKSLKAAFKAILQQKKSKIPKVTFSDQQPVAGSPFSFNRNTIEPHKKALEFLDSLIRQCTEQQEKENRLLQVAHKNEKEEGEGNRGVLKISLNSKVSSKSGLFNFDFDVNDLIKAAETQTNPQGENSPFTPACQ